MVKGPGTQTTAGDTTVERLGPFSFVQPRGALRITTDAVLLSGFAAPLTADDHVVDIGAGSGAIAMMILARFCATESDGESCADISSAGIRPTNKKIAANISAIGSGSGERADADTGPRPTKRMPKVTAVEIDADAAACIAENVRANGLEAFITPICADYRELPKRFATGTFDVVVTNPPYMKAGSARLSPVQMRAAARAELHGTLSDLLDTAEYLLTDRGRFFIVFTVDREGELLNGLSSRGFLIRRMSYVHAARGREARVLMVEAVKDSGEEGASSDVSHIYTGEPVA